MELIVTFSPTCKFSPIPTPPVTINAPLSKLVESVILFNLTSPSTSNES